MAVWMQIDLDLPEKPETRLIAMRTGEPIDVVCGRLLLFWRLVERECYKRNAGALPKYTTAILGHLCGGDSAFWEAVIEAGWLEETEDGLAVPGWEGRFSPAAKKRAQAAMRKARYDEKRKAEAEAGSNAQALPERSESVQERSEASGERDPNTKTKPYTKTKQEGLDETRRDDHGFSWNQETRVRVREFCARKFSSGRNAVFPAPIRENDRAFLLKLGALCVAGRLPEAILDGGLEAIRHHNGPVKGRAAYLTTVLRESCAARNLPLNRLLAQITIPEDLLGRPQASPPTH